MESNFFESIDVGHGRTEKRQCHITSNIEWMSKKMKGKAKKYRYDCINKVCSWKGIC